MATCCMLACGSDATESVNEPEKINDPSHPTAKEWNAGVVGWNLGNQFECSAPGQDGESMAIGNPDGSIKAETAWGNPVVTKKMIKAVKDAGFNAIRIPIRWQCHITNPQAMSIDKAWIARIKEVVDWCLANDLKVIINTHHDKWLEGRPTNMYKEENNQKLALLWMNIASEFAQYDYRVAFAGTNEVHIKDNWGKPTAENLAVQNSYNQTFIDMVRATGGNNEKRHLIVQTYVCNPDFGINNGDFIVPTDMEGNSNDYMSVEFHYYTPWDYAGECKYNYWGDPYKSKGEASSSDEKTMSDFFDKVVKRLCGERGVASTRIAYVSKIDGIKQVVVSDYDGFHRNQITRDTSISMMPVWTLGNKGLVYVNFKTNRPRLYTKAFGRSERALFTQFDQTYSPAVNPKTGELLFSSTKDGKTDLYIGDMESGKARKFAYLKSNQTSPAWSPLSDMRRVTFMGRYNERASWSPSGDRIVYTSMDNGKMNIYTCALDGSDIMQLTSNAGNNEHPTWSPDGKLIAFSSNRSGSYQIYIMRFDGANVTRITQGGENTAPTWSWFYEDKSQTTKEGAK